jgi:hypothetical protein
LKIIKRKGKEWEYDRWGPLLTGGVHTNGVMLSSIPDFQSLHPNKSWNELNPNPKTWTKLGKGRSRPQNKGRLRTAPLALQPNTRLVPLLPFSPSFVIPAYGSLYLYNLYNWYPLTFINSISDFMQATHIISHQTKGY